MTLQDDVAYAFVQEGNLRRIVQELVNEDPVDYDLEERSGEGWVDVAVKTANCRLLFEIKTHINVLPTGEIHEENVGGTIRQLKKYRKNDSSQVVAAIIPDQDAGRWAPVYANAGMWVIGWSGRRVVRCPGCKKEVHVNLVGPNHCHGDYCGYKGPFEHVSLKDPVFVLYDRYRPRDRKNTLWE
jgi:hypothetical protein